MPYTSDDLSVFECLRDRSLLEGTNYFEFHAGRRSSVHECWLEGSLFIQDAGFDFLAELFYQTVPNFDYFSFVDVQPQVGEMLVHRLGEFSRRLAAAHTRDEVFTFYSSLFGKEVWADVPGSDIAPRLRIACDHIRDYFKQALRAEEPVCILGM